jgi:hypothetical protein
LWNNGIGAVLEVLDGQSVTEVALHYGICRQSVYNWKDRYAASGVDGLKERSRRPDSRRQGWRRSWRPRSARYDESIARWAWRIRHELGRRGVTAVPCRATVHRALARNGLVDPQKKIHKRK